MKIENCDHSNGCSWHHQQVQNGMPQFVVDLATTATASIHQNGWGRVSLPHNKWFMKNITAIHKQRKRGKKKDILKYKLRHSKPRASLSSDATGRTHLWSLCRHLSKEITDLGQVRTCSQTAREASRPSLSYYLGRQSSWRPNLWTVSYLSARPMSFNTTYLLPKGRQILQPWAMGEDWTFHRCFLATRCRLCIWTPRTAPIQENQKGTTEPRRTRSRSHIGGLLTMSPPQSLI